MGIFDLFSSDSNIDAKKTIESDGQVNNNVIIQDEVQVTNSEMSIMMFIICIIQIIKIIIVIFKMFYHRGKRTAERDAVISGKFAQNP